ncbi:MAG: hypothetical protein KBC32_02030 [Candidatus Didemnitutus sp.]|nr:hypothetical protein [Candidatus Didemnitutus sp.]
MKTTLLRSRLGRAALAVATAAVLGALAAVGDVALATPAQPDDRESMLVALARGPLAAPLLLRIDALLSGQR